MFNFWNVNEQKLPKAPPFSFGSVSSRWEDLQKAYQYLATLSRHRSGSEQTPCWRYWLLITNHEASWNFLNWKNLQNDGTSNDLNFTIANGFRKRNLVYSWTHRKCQSAMLFFLLVELPQSTVQAQGQHFNWMYLTRACNWIAWWNHRVRREIAAQKICWSFNTLMVTRSDFC